MRPGAAKIFRPVHAVIAGTLALLCMTLGAYLLVASNLRQSTLAQAEKALQRHSLTLAEEADRSFKSLDLLLASVEDYLESKVPALDLSTNRAATAFETHLFLRDQLKGMPQVEAITIINPDGKLLNFSRYWPIPEVNISDRDYFKMLSANSDLRTYFGAPVRNRGNGTWNIYLARRINGPAGEFKGMILGAMALSYFEDFYRATSLGAGSSVSLLRTDGTLLARHPPAQEIGVQMPLPRELLVRGAGAITAQSPIEHDVRIKSGTPLANYPLLVLATQRLDAALEPWWAFVWTLGIMALAATLAIVAAAVALGRWLKQQSELARASAEQAEAEKALALAEAQLMREREQIADAANRAKSSFLAVISHEIRTPMNAVLGLASTLLSSDLSEEDRASVQSIYDAGDSLQEILNDVLDYSKLESGELALEEVAFDPASVATSVLAILTPRAQAKGLKLLQEIDPQFRPAVLGDPGRLRQVLLNVVSNAVKFTERGSVTVHLLASAGEGGRAVLEWRVKDTGIGIAEDRIGALFKDFVQADTSINRRYGGSGLGLAICKRIIERMGGEIAISSKLGEGSEVRFTVALPVVDKKLAEPSQAYESVEELRGVLLRRPKSARVLVVDDNATNRMIATKMLRDLPLEIATAADGTEAVVAAQQVAYDVILMDMRMPEMDGIAATRLIRSRPGPCRDAPIIAFTANAFADDVAACRAAGMTDFVAKPVRKQTLMDALVRALRCDAAAPAQPATARGEPARLPAAFDPEPFRLLERELGRQAADEALALFVDEADRRLRAMETETRRDEDAASELERAAHSLKGMAATFGFTRLSSLAAAFEKQIKAGHGGPNATDEIARLREAFEHGRAGHADGRTAQQAA